jgi:GDP-4-dehydro-6-deoxy-D-mannose reductase
MRILITGITGFMGSHLAQYLFESGYQDLHGTTRKNLDKQKNSDDLNGRVHYYECDLLNTSTISSLVEKIKPELVFHLAAELPRADVNKSPEMILQNNILATVNLLESIRKNAPQAKVLISGSCTEYGAISPEDGPIKENHVLLPVTPYEVSKTIQFFLGTQYFQHFGMKIYHARVFYLTGPGQPEWFVCPSIVKQAVLLKKRLIPIITVGNLKVKRDYIDIRDAVSALFLITERGIPGEVYNVCSGKAYSIEEILKIITEFAELKNTDVSVDPALVRKSENPVFIGDNSKISADIKWKPLFNIKESLRDLMKEYQSKI